MPKVNHSDDDTLFIVEWNADGTAKDIYRVDQKLWKVKANVVTDDPVTAPLWPLIKKGVVLAGVPELSAEGCACYLVNLTALAIDPPKKS